MSGFGGTTCVDAEAAFVENVWNGTSLLFCPTCMLVPLLLPTKPGWLVANAPPVKLFAIGFKNGFGALSKTLVGCPPAAKAIPGALDMV